MLVMNVMRKLFQKSHHLMPIIVDSDHVVTVIDYLQLLVFDRQGVKNLVHTVKACDLIFSCMNHQQWTLQGR